MSGESDIGDSTLVRSAHPPVVFVGDVLNKAARHGKAVERLVIGLLYAAVNDNQGRVSVVRENREEYFESLLYRTDISELLYMIKRQLDALPEPVKSPGYLSQILGGMLFGAAAIATAYWVDKLKDFLS